MRKMNTCVSVDCDQDLKKRLTVISKKHGMTISAVVRLALEQSIDSLDERLTQLRKPIAA